MSLQQDAQQWLYGLLNGFKNFRDSLNEAYKIGSEVLIIGALDRGCDLIRVVRGLGGFYYKFYLVCGSIIIAVTLDNNGINNLRLQEVKKLLNYAVDRNKDLPIRFNLDYSFRLSIANNFGYVDIYFGEPLIAFTMHGIFAVDELAYLNNGSLVIKFHDKPRNIKSLHITQLLPKLECLCTSSQEFINCQELCASILNGLYCTRRVVMESWNALVRISHYATVALLY
jgi:hypothetical protein